MRRAALPLVVLLVLAGCAGTLRDRIRTSAMLTGEAALTIDQAERDLYATGAYDAATHKELGGYVLTALTAVRAYERAAAAWPKDVTMPDTIPQLLADAMKALAALERIVQGVPGNGKLLANIAHARAKIGGQS